MADWKCRGINSRTVALDPWLTRVQARMPQLPRPGCRGDSGMCSTLSPSIPQRGPAPVVHRGIGLDDTPFIDPFPSLCHSPLPYWVSWDHLLINHLHSDLRLRISNAYGGNQTKIQTMVTVLDRITFPPWRPHPNPQNL